MKKLIACLALLLSLNVLTAEENLLKNPGFEEADKNGRPLSWGISNASVEACSLDDQVARSGKYSLRFSDIKSYIAAQQSFGEISSLDGDYRLSGWVKYENIRNDTVDFKTFRLPFFGIWTSLNGRNSLNFNALSFPAGSSDWQHFEIIYRQEDIQGMIAKRNFADRPTSWAIRINISQQPGTVWFDDLSFVKLEQVPQVEAALNSKAYVANSRNAILSLNLKNTHTQQQLKVKVLVVSETGQEVIQQEYLVSSDISTLTLPTRNLPVGAYRLTCTPETTDINACEVSFNISPDPFAE